MGNSRIGNVDKKNASLLNVKGILKQLLVGKPFLMKLDSKVLSDSQVMGNNIPLVNPMYAGNSLVSASSKLTGENVTEIPKVEVPNVNSPVIDMPQVNESVPLQMSNDLGVESAIDNQVLHTPQSFQEEIKNQDVPLVNPIYRSNPFVRATSVLAGEDVTRPVASSQTQEPVIDNTTNTPIINNSVQAPVLASPIAEPIMGGVQVQEPEVVKEETINPLVNKTDTEILVERIEALRVKLNHELDELKDLALANGKNEEAIKTAIIDGNNQINNLLNSANLNMASVVDMPNRSL